MTHSVEYWVEEYKRRLIEVQQEACIELSRRIIIRTPVDEGVLRASWTPTINQFESGTSMSPPDSTNWQGTINEIEKVVSGLMPGDTFYLANPQPYARVIEYNGRYIGDEMVPYLMVSTSIAEWPQILKEAASGV